MPGTRITDEQKRQFFYLTLDKTGPRISVEAACKQVGISPASGYRLTQGTLQKGLTDANRKGLARARQADLPAPKKWDELSTDGKEALRDFNVFSELFFARRPSPWRKDAADRLVGLLMDKSERSFVDLNVFPGAGKTTVACHDIPAWLICGGGSLDPSYGRAIRLMLGGRVMKVAVHNVLRLRRSLELRRPFYDKEQRRYAELVLANEYGRFKPDTSLGEESLWSQEQFLVAQMEDLDLYDKEPTVQAAARDSGFLGERVDAAFWDDLAVYQNSRTPEQLEDLAGWTEDEAETRVEPGGLFALIGQRLSPLDLHRNRLDAVELDDDGVPHKKYHHIVYPAHRDAECDGDHRQWDPEEGTGCLTDAWRLSRRDWMSARAKENYRTVYQQEDADPEKVLVQHLWLEGGTDPVTKEVFPGCYDRDRAWQQYPEGVGTLIDYATLDPSAGNWWVLQHWAVQPETKHNYLIEGKRAKIAAGAFLDWDEPRKEFTGWMHEMQVESLRRGRPIRVWVIEAVAAHKYLFQFQHFRRWKQAFPYVTVIAHQTQMNKNDPELGVQGLLPGRYRTGMKHLPKAPGVEGLNFLRVLEEELTKYPYHVTDDCVMADWCGEWNLDVVIQAGRRQIDSERTVDPDVRLPKYLQRQLQETRM